MRAALAAVAILLCLPVCSIAQNGPPIGDLELPEYGASVSGLVNISGWALDFEDETITVNVFLDGQSVGQAVYPSGDRPDIQSSFSDVPWSLHTAFGFSLDSTAYPNGSHRIRVIATDPLNETTVIGETAVTFDNGTTPTGRPWPDTTDRVGVFTDQIADSVTNQQASFVAHHCAGCQKITRALADTLRLYNPDFLVLHYRLGLGLGYRAPDAQGQPTGPWLMIIEGNNWVREWPASPPDEWFYPYAGSPRVYQNQWGWYLIDPDNAAWRSYWLAEVRRQMQANDADGLFADSFSVPNFMGASRFTPNLPDVDSVFESAWSGKIARWIAAIKQDFGSAYQLIPNVGNWITTRDTTDYSGADGVMVEWFAQWAPGVPYSLADWQLQMDRILALSSAGRVVIMQSYIDNPSDLNSRKFLLANYLLVKGAKSFINIEMSAEPEWFPEYGADLGPPVSAQPAQVSALFRADWGVYARQYARGLVLVNPTNTARTVNVGSGYSRFDAVGGGVVPATGDVKEWHLDFTPVTSVTLPPGTAEVLIAGGPDPAALAVTPDISFSAIGPYGGPFTPASVTYLLTNTGALPVTWTASALASSPWLSVSPSSGTIDTGEQVALTISLTPAAALLNAGTYQDTITISNVTNGIGSTTRGAQIHVAAGPVTGFVEVGPLAPFLAAGTVGGPFSPDKAVYSVYNPGDLSLQLAVTHEVGENWLTISHYLPARQTLDVTVAINESANALPPGTHLENVTFANMTNGQGDTTRPIQLQVLGGQLEVTPSDGLASSGYQGGPFSPSQVQYTLRNTGGAALLWTAAHNQSVVWLGLSAASGMLNPGASTVVTAWISPDANNLPGGTYTDTITFTNATDGAGSTTRPVQLVISDGRLQVSPASGFSPGGSTGGTFAPASQDYTLSNPGNSSITWTVSHDPLVNWLDISQASGTLAPGGIGLVTVSVNGNAPLLSNGVYHDTLSLTNTTNGSGNTTRAVTLTVASKSLIGLDLTPTALDCPSTDSRQIYATARFSDGTSQEVTTVAQWSSSSAAIATVSATGLVTPHSQGSAIITCSYTEGGVTRTATCAVTVRYRSLSYLYVTPLSRTFYQSTPFQYQCQARMSDGWLNITEACTWTSSDPTVAMVDRRGVVTPVRNGVATIRASYVYNGTNKAAQGTAVIKSF